MLGLTVIYVLTAFRKLIIIKDEEQRGTSAYAGTLIISWSGK